MISKGRFCKDSVLEHVHQSTEAKDFLNTLVKGALSILKLYAPGLASDSMERRAKDPLLFSTRTYLFSYEKFTRKAQDSGDRAQCFWGRLRSNDYKEAFTLFGRGLYYTLLREAPLLHEVEPPVTMTNKKGNVTHSN